MKKISKLKSHIKLKLDRETIRVLTTADFKRILGGIEAQDSEHCTHSESFCPTL